MDNFGVKYIGCKHLQYLYNALRKETYEIVEDWTGDLYCGTTLKWNYKKHHVDLAMPAYVKNQFTKYSHVASLKPQHCSYAPNPIKYGKDNQAPSPLDKNPHLNKAQKTRIQQIVNSFLYCAQEVDPTILMALSEIALQQAAPTENTMECVNQFLDYMWTHPDAIIQYRASDKILNVLYLSAPKACSRTGGYFFLGSIPQDGNTIKLIEAIHITCTILKLVAASAAEVELGALFLNTQEAKVLRLILIEINHPQPPTPIHIDNTTAVGIVNNTIKRQRSQAMEMRYFWLLDCKMQQYFKFYYQPGFKNLGNYPSKHDTANIHQHVRPYYVHMNNPLTLLPRAMMPSTLQGCAEIHWDSKKSPLPSIANFPCLADSPKLSSHQVLGQSRIQHRHITFYNHPRIDAQ